MSYPNLEAGSDMFARSVKAHWRLFLAEGILLLVLGAAALLLPPLASIAVTILIGWLFLISGIAGLFTTFWARDMPGFWWSLISAVLAIAVGVMLVGWPLRGTFTLTLVVGVFFVAEGIATIMYALEHRRDMSGRWGWMLASGVIDLILAAIIITGLPGTAVWALGVLVGINLIFGGVAMIAMALAARKLAS